MKIKIYTDGACSGNPGPGGWGAILIHDNKQKEICGREDHTTNNRMELMAVLMSLKELKKPCEIDLYTDSTYVKNGMTSWIFNWQKNNWRTADKKPVKNADLWQEIFELSKNHQILWHWVKAHNGDVFNERADKLAVSCAQLKNATN
jgi:ribonuclease HI